MEIETGHRDHPNYKRAMEKLDEYKSRRNYDLMGQSQFLSELMETIQCLDYLFMDIMHERRLSREPDIPAIECYLDVIIGFCAMCKEGMKKRDKVKPFPLENPITGPTIKIERF